MDDIEVVKCSKCIVSLCGDVRKKVCQKQADHLVKTGRHLSKEKAIQKIILGK